MNTLCRRVPGAHNSNAFLSNQCRGQWGSRRTALPFDGQIRALHCSPRVLNPSESYAADDHVVPDYYIRHKLGRKGNSKSQAASTSSSTSPVAQTLSSFQARTVATDATVDSAPAPLHENPSTLTTRAIKARKEEEAPLMEQLFDSVLSDEIAASTRRLRAKIPVEYYDPTHDVIRHPSGFVVPGNGHASTSDAARAKEHARDDEEDRALQTTNVAERVKESDLDSVHAACASTRSRMGKVPCEVREPDGTFKHPSGFIPPTSVQEFECVDSVPSMGRDTEVVVRQRVHDSKR
ncbi:hypothetical protein EV401DRAFT_1883061 [Pisolithus croceorrhizus]|nr:hypothetical protein EV401DRAFT_1883061 [Pisolithus croceorrhizus]